MYTLRRAMTLLAGFAITLTALVSAASLAVAQVPPPDPSAPTPQPPAVISNGAPIWAFILVAAGAVALTVATTLIVHKLHHQARPAHA